MFRLAYRNFIDHESLVVSHSVDPGITGVVSGVRWYDFRISGQPDAVCSTYPCTYQQGTVADVPNGRSRWMPSISMDGAENILVGYSATGTLGSDRRPLHPLHRPGQERSSGTMTVPETIIFTGTRNIVNDPAAFSPGRWGDYTSTSIDPSDDCTFWHVNEYYRHRQAPPTANWHTRIASAAFPAGTGPGNASPRPAPLARRARQLSAPHPLPATNQIQVTWTAITPAAGSYAIERAVGAAGSEGLYQPLGVRLRRELRSYIDTTSRAA